MEDITKKSTVDLINELTKLDQEIDLRMLKYERIRLELIRRYPNIKDSEEFKEKKKCMI